MSNNYYEFTNFIEDGFAMDIFNGMSNERLKNILDNYLNEIDYFLDLFADTSKSVFKEKDYDVFYYQSKSLIGQINDIKIIINILAERNKNE